MSQTYLARVTYVKPLGLQTFASKKVEGETVTTFGFLAVLPDGLSLDVTAFNDNAEFLANTLQVGHNVEVISGGVTQSYEKDGAKIFTMPKVQAKFVNVLGQSVRPNKAEVAVATVATDGELDFG